MNRSSQNHSNQEAPVSIIIPTYNNRQLLQNTIASLATQSHGARNLEIIVVDNDSDEDMECPLGVFKNLLNIRIIKRTGLERKFCPGSARNLGISAASHELIILLDSDCIPSTELVKSHVNTIRKGKYRLASIAPRKFVCIDGLSWETILNYPQVLQTLPEVESNSNWGLRTDRRMPEFQQFGNHPMPFNCFHGCNVAFRKLDAEAVGLFDPTFDGYWGYEDIEFGYRLYKSGVKLAYNAEGIVYHQENDVLAISDRLNGRQRNLKIACDKIPGFRDFRGSLGR